MVTAMGKPQAENLWRHGIILQLYPRVAILMLKIPSLPEVTVRTLQVVQERGDTAHVPAGSINFWNARLTVSVSVTPFGLGQHPMHP